MKRTFRLLSILLVLSPAMALSYDWEDEVGGPGNGTAQREIQLTRNRTYPGGADEQDLKVQKSLTQATRSPVAAPEVTKRDDAEPDEE